MSRLFRPLAVCALAWSLAGCIHSTASVLDSSLAKADPSRMGYIAGSVGQPGKSRVRYSSQGIEICNGAKRVVAEFMFKDEFSKEDPDIHESRIEGKSFSLALPEGRYSFCDFWFFVNGGQFSSTFHAKEQFDIPFEVRAGQVTYVGEFLGMPVMGRNIFGMRVANGGYWLVSDHLERDIPLVSAKAKDIAGRQVLSGVPDVDRYGHPLVRSTPLPGAE